MANIAEKAVDEIVESESKPVEAKALEQEDSDSANKTDPELYRKVVEAREDKGVPTPIKPKKSFSGNLTGPDGITGAMAVTGQQGITGEDGITGQDGTVIVSPSAVKSS